MLTQLPLNTNRDSFVSVEMPELNGIVVSPNTQRSGRVVSLATKITKSGYGVLVIEFVAQGETKSQWATISPFA
jgi:hypothetical protein